MFVSHPSFEFPMPPDHSQPGVQHWRMLELTLQAPWFLLSEEVGAPEFSATQTLCIAWEYDLADVLQSMDPSRVKGLVCMMPAERPEAPPWSPREIQEVWVHSSAMGRHVVLSDVAGHQFTCGLTPDHVGPIRKELLLRLASRPLSKQSSKLRAGRAN